MSQSKPGKSRWVDISAISGEDGREDEQGGWQEFVGRLFSGVSILDVGAGLGKSRTRLAAGGNHVQLQDVAPLLPVDLPIPIESIESASFDIVTAFDVIEHVAEDVEFIKHVHRIASHFAFISTPNERVSKAHNSHHVREYSPGEFLELTDSRFVRCFAGDAAGHSIVDMPRSEFIDHNLPHQAILIWTGK